MKTHILIISFLLSLLSFHVNAQRGQYQHENQKYSYRDHRHPDRCREDLSRREHHKLRHEQRRIHQSRRFMLRDGHLSPWEKRELKHMRRHHKRHVWREGHDGNRW